MGHFYHFGNLRFQDVEILFAKGDTFDNEQKQEILQRIDEVIAVVDFDGDVDVVSRATYRQWKQDNELDPSDPQTFEEYVKVILESSWPIAVIFRR